MVQFGEMWDDEYAIYQAITTAYAVAYDKKINKKSPRRSMAKGSRRR